MLFFPVYETEQFNQARKQQRENVHNCGESTLFEGKGLHIIAPPREM